MLQLPQNRPILLLDQARVVRLRRRLELPLVLEQRRLIDVAEDFAEIEVLLHAHAVERRLRNLDHLSDSSGAHRHGLALVGSRGGSFLRELLHRAPFGEALFALPVGGAQVLHQVQAGEGVIGVEHGRGVLAPQVVFHVLTGQRRAPADDGELQPLALQVLDDILHLHRGLHQQAAQPDGVGAVRRLRPG